ncbi:MAG: DUF368 domain-containing protein, partial [Clostridia bacterium]|nr:DUF368 domain-containing protein [Clostridia bacterium]
SGGTMMVSMGIYDKLIYCINHLFREFRKCVLTLLPYAIGMVAAILLGAFGLKAAFANYPLPTNTLFIGLILGSIPMILRQMRGEKTGFPGLLIFLLFFAAVVVLKLIERENTAALGTGVLDLLKYLLLGMLASATMVIPGVSGSMLLKTLGYYEPIVTETLTSATSALAHRSWDVLGHDLLILAPFAIGIVIGVFAIAKLIEALMKRWKGLTYCAILGMVAASPVVILIDPGVWAKGTGWLLILVSVATFVLGFLIATKLGREEPSALS